MYLNGFSKGAVAFLFSSSVSIAFCRKSSVTDSSAFKYWTNVSRLFTLSFLVSANLLHLSEAGNVFQNFSKPGVYLISESDSSLRKLNSNA